MTMQDRSPSISAELNVSDLSLAFGGLKALTNVSFSVAPGSITAVIGPNGAGKTSLFNCISGFYRPSTGVIKFGGEDISRLHPPARAKIGLARTFQNIALFRGMTVLDNIKLGRHAHMQTNVFDALWYFGRAKREELELRSEIERRVLDFLEMEHIRDQPVASLSYGLRKRVELARALAMKPRILMLDEPVAGMSVSERTKTAELLNEVIKNRSVIVIEHDMKFVESIAHRVTVLHQGKVLAEGKMDAIQANPEVKEVYLGH